MKKSMLFVLLFLAGGVAFGQGLADIVNTTLVNHVSPVTQLKSGRTDVALMDSVVLIGKYKGNSILDLQMGIAAPTQAAPGEPNGGSFIYGGFFKVSTLVKSFVTLSQEFVFLNNVEHGVSLTYDTRSKKYEWSYQIGYPFDLAPSSTRF